MFSGSGGLNASSWGLALLPVVMTCLWSFKKSLAGQCEGQSGRLG